MNDNEAETPVDDEAASEEGAESGKKKRRGGSNAAKRLDTDGREDAHKFFPWKLTMIVSKRVAKDVKMLAAAGFLTLRYDESHTLYHRKADRPVNAEMVQTLGPVALGGESQIHNIKIQMDGPDRLIVVGRGRTKAIAMRNYNLCQKMGKTKEELIDQMQRVTTTILRGTELDAWRVMNAENYQRDDSTRMEKVFDAQKGLDLGVPDEVVARTLRVSVPQMKLKLLLLDLDPEVQAAIDTGELPESTGYLTFVKWPRAEQVKNLIEMRAAGTLKGQAAQEAIAEIKKGNKPVKSAEPAKRAPSKKKLKLWVDAIKEKAPEKDRFAAGVRAGMMKALGMQPKGWSEVKEYLDE